VGLLLTRFSRLDVNFFNGKIPEFIVRLKDVKGHEYSASMKATGEYARAGHISGLAEFTRPIPNTTPQPPATK
jgi:hypothetical protein